MRVVITYAILALAAIVLGTLSQNANAALEYQCLWFNQGSQIGVGCYIGSTDPAADEDNWDMIGLNAPDPSLQTPLATGGSAAPVDGSIYTVPYVSLITNCAYGMYSAEADFRRRDSGESTLYEFDSDYFVDYWYYGCP